MTIPEELFYIFRERLDSLMSASQKKFRFWSFPEAKKKFFKKLEPDVLCMYSQNLANLINSGPVDAYAIPYPGDAIMTIVVKREFAMKVVTLGHLP